jgi:hypothetical protein
LNESLFCAVGDKKLAADGFEPKTKDLMSPGESFASKMALVQVEKA